MGAKFDPEAATLAFSKQSTAFDAIDGANPLIGWVRDRVRRVASASMRSGDRMLELNAGTGIDSTHFAAQGIHVLATDGAVGMVEALRAKQAARPELPLEVKHCSFNELSELDRRFEHVFSNFGGLNCTDRLEHVLREIDRVLLPEGTCTLVIMPRFSPWESASILKGNWKMASRRWRKEGAAAVVEGVPFTTTYYSAAFVRRHLGRNYKVLEQRALSVLVPPPYKEGFTQHWPLTFRFLSWIEDRIAHLPVIRNWGDHFVISLKKTR
ncbi:MAG: class I SAM-dependent methyltransferase [Flavobacteriales bacterium]